MGGSKPPETPGSPEEKLTFVILYGPLVQFARQQGAAEPTVVAMPPQLPISVDIVFTHPPEATPPDNLSHFCFSSLMKLHEPSELSFCLTDSSGDELFGVSLHMLCPQGDRSLHCTPIPAPTNLPSEAMLPNTMIRAIHHLLCEQVQVMRRGVRVAVLSPKRKRGHATGQSHSVF